LDGLLLEVGCAQYMRGYMENFLLLADWLSRRYGNLDESGMAAQQEVHQQLVVATRGSLHLMLEVQHMQWTRRCKGDAANVQQEVQHEVQQVLQQAQRGQPKQAAQKRLRAAAQAQAI
jgi:hypothetical protein